MQTFIDTVAYHCTDPINPFCPFAVWIICSEMSWTESTYQPVLCSCTPGIVEPHPTDIINYQYVGGELWAERIFLTRKTNILPILKSIYQAASWECKQQEDCDSHLTSLYLQWLPPATSSFSIWVCSEVTGLFCFVLVNCKTVSLPYWKSTESRTPDTKSNSQTSLNDSGVQNGGRYAAAGVWRKVWKK